MCGDRCPGPYWRSSSPRRRPRRRRRRYAVGCATAVAWPCQPRASRSRAATRDCPASSLWRATAATSSPTCRRGSSTSRSRPPDSRWHGGPASCSRWVRSWRSTSCSRWQPSRNRSTSPPRPSTVDTTRSVIDAVIPSTAIDALPLNGRNFLELALLVPGNAPAPNFDPTKSNSVVISSAGQLGRGGNITIDGADNNDDVVGGPLQNVTQEAVQEFQIATNRFTAESGRSASSVINVVTRVGHRSSCADRCRSSARDSSWQGLPATFDRSSGDSLPFDRQQVAGAAGGPIVAGRAFWFGAAEYRNQDGAVLVGERDVAARAIRRSFCRRAARRCPRGRGAWTGGRTTSTPWCSATPRERADDTGASSLDRAIGSALVPAAQPQHLQLGRRHLDTAARPDARQRRHGVLQHLRQRDRAGRIRSAAHVPEHARRLVVPRAAGHDTEALPGR